MNIQISIPEAMAPFAIVDDEAESMTRNAMILYPFIQRGEISHGYAAEILGITKLDLIEIYGDLDLSYFCQSEDELEDDLNTLRLARSSNGC